MVEKILDNNKAIWKNDIWKCLDYTTFEYLHESIKTIIKFNKFSKLERLKKLNNDQKVEKTIHKFNPVFLVIDSLFSEILRKYTFGNKLFEDKNLLGEFLQKLFMEKDLSKMNQSEYD